MASTASHVGLYIIASEASFLVEFNGTDFLSLSFYIYLFQSVRRAVNVLKVFLRVSKYPPNAIFRSANINTQRANVTGSINCTIHNRGRLCKTRLRSPDACILLVIYLSVCQSGPGGAHAQHANVTGSLRFSIR